MTTAIVRTTTAVGYFRVSGPGQTGERHVSLEVQEAAFRDCCRSHHLEPGPTFTDVISGRKDDRAQYKAMLAYVAEHGIGHVIVLFLDRFGRNPREILRRYWELQERGTTVESINEDLQEELMLLLRAGIAGQDSKRTSERVIMALRRAAEKGKLVSKLPFGYIKVRDINGERVEQVPEEATAVRLAYEMATVRNMGYKGMADELNRLGYRTKSGALFAAQSLKLILVNPAMAGHAVFRGQGEEIITEDAYPAILDPKEWNTLQQRLAIRREGQPRGNTGSSPYLLTGILRCGHCGGAMAGSSKGPNKYQYYVCCNRKMASALCDQSISHRKDPLEAAILEHLGQYSDPEMVRDLLEAHVQDMESGTEAELDRVNGRLAELEQSFLKDLDRVDRGILTEPEYLKRQEARREEQGELQSRQSELEASIATQRDIEAQSTEVPVKVRSFLEDFQEMDVRQAKAILQGIIKAVYLWSNGKAELRFRGKYASQD